MDVLLFSMKFALRQVKYADAYEVRFAYEVC